MPVEVLAVIPARAGSKRLVGKNRRSVGGRTLVERAVEVARAASTVTGVVVSTDDDEIAVTVDGDGVVVRRRPAHLADDVASSWDVVRDAIDQVGSPDVVVLLQPTSPLRRALDVDRCVLEHLRHDDRPPVVSVTAVDHPPEWTFEVHDGRLAAPGGSGWAAVASRSQDLPVRWRLNGAVYVCSPAWLASGEPVVGPRTRAVEMDRRHSVDVDTEDDLRWAEFLVADESEDPA